MLPTSAYGMYHSFYNVCKFILKARFRRLSKFGASTRSFELISKTMNHGLCHNKKLESIVTLARITKFLLSYFFDDIVSLANDFDGIEILSATASMRRGAVAKF